MARARNIKPGFFTNDVLAECCPLARILFQGLWCHADREGRLEDRPRKLKAEILPYDDCDIENLLDQLSSKGFVIRYQHGSSRFIQVVNFVKHQNPHIKESESTIPAPCLSGASTEQAENKPEQARLIPDSPLLIPDSLQEQAQPEEPKSKTATATRLPADWVMSEQDSDFCKTERPDLSPEVVATRFRDYWIATPGAKGRKLDWSATWRNWVRNEKAIAQPRASPRRNIADEREAASIALTGRKPNYEPHHANTERDITGLCERVAG